ncbi:PorT family protein [Spirosoma sp. BT702]|uniref:PorT family protein n=1 Tax=Spirosoma profusum TaxID=2771354 RepID=A0A927AU19_9BACT|nr:porin family protein [Spirosoma profusum]MBD2701997.1 PorT family protein [Spirosoma profusum]
MKKFTVLTVCLFITVLTSFAQVRIGVTGGLQMANQKNSIGGFSISGTNRIGYTAGLLIDAALSESFSIRPQILYSVKGTKFDLGGLSGGLANGNVTLAFNYIEVPIQVTYGLEAGPGRLVLGAGPYVGYALSGTTSGSVQGQSGSENIEFGSAEDQVKRLDYGLRLSGGYELSSGLSISAFYSPGLANLANGSNQTTTNTAFGLTLGFLFGGE